MLQELVHASVGEFRLLVAASDADSVFHEFVVQEAKLIEEVFKEYGAIHAVVEPLSTVDRIKFQEVVKNLKPHAIHYVKRGSPEPYVRMVDKTRWSRRFSIGSVSRILYETGTNLEFLFFNNCRLWGGVGGVPDNTKTSVSIFSNHETFDIPLEVLSLFYQSIAEHETTAQALWSFQRRLIESDLSQELVLRVLGDIGYEDLLDVKDISADQEPQRVMGYQLPLVPNKFEAFSNYHQYLNANITFLTQPKPGSTKAFAQFEARAPRSELVVSRPDGPHLYRVWFGTNRKALIYTTNP